MKKIILGLLAMMVSVTLLAERISPDDAALVANNFMNVASAPGVKKAVPQKKMVRKATADENLFYVYENANGEGWVLVAANDAVTPILAYSETGHFCTDNMPTNVRGWLGKYNKFITKIETDGVVASEETTEQWNTLRKGVRKAAAAAVVGPLVKTQWDQDDPYYNLCPGTGSNKAYTGCVATAMAQVMKYWEWPVKGTGSHSYQPLNPNTGKKSTRYSTQSANFGATTYDWANMLNSYKSTANAAQKTAVATLMYHCGVATEMMYGNDADGGSGTYTVNYGEWETSEMPCAQNALVEFFGYKKSTITGYMRDGYSEGGTTYYTKWTDDAWTKMVKEELDKKHPIMYAGAGSGGGHSFICDGYDSNGKFHFNWGWSGSNDGYYTLSNLAPGSGGAGGGSYDFSEEQDVIIGIVPDKKDMPKVTVTWSVNGETSTSVFYQEDALVLPAEPSSCADDLDFVGWTALSSISGNKPFDLFRTATGKTVNEAITYYAVFARLDGDVQAEETTTYTFTSKSWGEATKTWSSIKDGYQYNKDRGVQITKAFTGAGAKTTKSFDNVAKVVITYSTNSSAGAGSIEVKVGDQTESKSVTSSGGTSNRELVYNFDKATGSASFELACTTNSIYVKSITLTTGGSATYKDYTTSCSGTATVETSIPAQQNVVKAIRNGEVVIIRGNDVYTILGVKK